MMEARLPHVETDGRALPEPSATTTLVGAAIMLTTGVRVSELVSVRLADIDLIKGTIRVLGKGHRERVVYLADPWLTELLDRYLDLRNERAASHDFLLFNVSGDPLTASRMRARLVKAAEAAGLQQRVTPHMLRHSAATQLVEAGVSIRFIQRLLGHASLATTEIYTHVSDEALRSAMTNARVLEAARG